ncbi:hypothetical protein UPYG_G00306190 [Umbra pygmaea]|uniref:G-protein coupled receptor 156 n=1 Tax=Umbra pygmaea TaxID=75934 RepID=A0ABD0VYP0_UMBPY
MPTLVSVSCCPSKCNVLSQRKDYPPVFGFGYVRGLRGSNIKLNRQFFSRRETPNNGARTAARSHQSLRTILTSFSGIFVFPQDVCLTADRLDPAMELDLNCSSHCDSRRCLIQHGVNKQAGLEILQRLCSLSTTGKKKTKHTISDRAALLNTGPDPEMSSVGSLLSEDQFLCPICLEVFSSPITTPCGHNFCKDCIHRYWNTTNPCQCPMCKQKFSRKPELKVNTFISEMANQFRRSVEMMATATAQDPPLDPDQTQAAQPGEVHCDICPGRQVKALKSCLECLASYCEIHLEPHQILPTFKKHNLMEPVMNMEDRVCKRHQRLLGLFCRSDQTYLCQICTEKRHQKHNVVTLEEESRDRGTRMRKMEEAMQEMIRCRQQKVKEIQRTIQAGRINAKREVTESMLVFGALLRSVQRSQAELLGLIEEKQKTAERRAEGLITELEQEVIALKKRSSELERLSHTKDHLHVTQSFPSLCTVPPTREWSEVRVQSVVYVGTVRRAVRRAGAQFEETLKSEVKRLCEVELGRIQQCAVDVTLDPNTAHPKLIISDNGKQVAHSDTALNVPDTPERFYPGISVLGRQGFSSGRFFYEVQVMGKTEWDIGVGRESVNRKGGNTLNPERGYWTLGLRKKTEYWALTNPPVALPLLDKPQTVGVYVDWDAGQVEAEVQRRSLSPVVCAVVWFLLSCGILVALCFLLFTLRFKNNRIVKMSSPNLNVLTLCGSVLTYCSGFLFALDERIYLLGGGPRAVFQARIWMLCIGSTLVFGPILGKTWRLYRVFTQRMPDKRVIIRDIQLMGFVVLLILGDLLVLSAWSLTDPVRCARSIGAVVKVVERDISYSLSHLHSCSSVYSDLWVILLAVIKGNLLLYGTYLAGLTSNVSLPPVNQSPTIKTAVSLITLSTAVAVPVSQFLQAWPNVVYSVVAGSILICTLATNCMLFVPQLTQWRRFEEEHNNPSQMAKYFSSPSKSVHSVYSQDELYYLLGENDSMKRLLNEKNAVIDSLQEQVTNAKDKLLRLMSDSHAHQDLELDSSSTNLHSSSTQTTEVQSDCPPTPESQRDGAEPTLTSALAPSARCTPPSGAPCPPLTAHPALSRPSVGGVKQWSVEFGVDFRGEKKEIEGCTVEGSHHRGVAERSNLPAFVQPCVSSQTGVRSPGARAGAATTPSCQSGDVTSSSHPSSADSVPAQSETQGCRSNPASLWAPGRRQMGFVSSAQLQEILRELSVDAVMETALRSPNHSVEVRRHSQPTSARPLVVSPLSLRSPPHQPVFFRYPSISPYAMRKRRPPFHSARGGPPDCYFSGSELPCRARRSETGPSQPEKNLSKTQHQLEHGTTETGPPLPDDRGTEEGKESGRYRQVEDRCGRRGWRRERRLPPPRKCSGLTSLPSGGVGGEKGPDFVRDATSYWDSDSSSSADYCFHHHPYCDTWRQHGSYPSSDSSSSDSSDIEYGGFNGPCRSHPVVNFKEDFIPTFV